MLLSVWLILCTFLHGTFTSVLYSSPSNVIQIKEFNIKGNGLDDATALPRNRRNKRSLTTICVEIRPNTPQDRPFYMCKDADWPTLHTPNGNHASVNLNIQNHIPDVKQQFVEENTRPTNFAQTHTKSSISGYSDNSFQNPVPHAYHSSYTPSSEFFLSQFPNYQPMVQPPSTYHHSEQQQLQPSSQSQHQPYTPAVQTQPQFQTHTQFQPQQQPNFQQIFPTNINSPQPQTFHREENAKTAFHKPAQSQIQAKPRPQLQPHQQAQQTPTFSKGYESIYESFSKKDSSQNQHPTFPSRSLTSLENRPSDSRTTDAYSNSRNPIETNAHLLYSGSSQTTPYAANSYYRQYEQHSNAQYDSSTTLPSSARPFSTSTKSIFSKAEVLDRGSTLSDSVLPNLPFSAPRHPGPTTQSSTRNQQPSNTSASSRGEVKFTIPHPIKNSEKASETTAVPTTSKISPPALYEQTASDFATTAKVVDLKASNVETRPALSLIRQRELVPGGNQFLQHGDNSYAAYQHQPEKHLPLQLNHERETASHQPYLQAKNFRRNYSPFSQVQVPMWSVPTARHSGVDSDVFAVPNWNFSSQELETLPMPPERSANVQTQESLVTYMPTTARATEDFYPKPHYLYPQAQQLHQHPQFPSQHIPPEHMNDPVMRQWYASLQEPPYPFDSKQAFRGVESILLSSSPHVMDAPQSLHSQQYPSYFQKQIIQPASADPGDKFSDPTAQTYENCATSSVASPYRECRCIYASNVVPQIQQYAAASDHGSILSAYAVPRSSAENCKQCLDQQLQSSQPQTMHIQPIFIAIPYCGQHQQQSQSSPTNTFSTITAVQPQMYTQALQSGMSMTNMPTTATSEYQPLVGMARPATNLFSTPVAGNAPLVGLFNPLMRPLAPLALNPFGLFNPALGILGSTRQILQNNQQTIQPPVITNFPATATILGPMHLSLNPQREPLQIASEWTQMQPGQPTQSSTMPSVGRPNELREDITSDSIATPLLPATAPVPTTTSTLAIVPTTQPTTIATTAKEVPVFSTTTAPTPSIFDIDHDSIEDLYSAKQDAAAQEQSQKKQTQLTAVTSTTEPLLLGAASAEDDDKLPEGMESATRNTFNTMLAASKIFSKLSKKEQPTYSSPAEVEISEDNKQQAKRQHQKAASSGGMNSYKRKYIQKL